VPVASKLPKHKHGFGSFSKSGCRIEQAGRQAVRQLKVETGEMLVATLDLRILVDLTPHEPSFPGQARCLRQAMHSQVVSDIILVR